MWPPPGSDWKTFGGYALVRRAAAFLEAHLGEPIRIAELCAVAGTSTTNLEQAFLELQGIKRYLTTLWLARARRALPAVPQFADRIEFGRGCGRIHRAFQLRKVPNEMCPWSVC